MNEFEIIEHFFRRQDEQHDSDVILGIGDDAAVVDIPAHSRLVVCMDTLVSGVHFPGETAPEDIAWKALAVNMSDMAAMGATPRWITLSLTAPRHDDSWFESFANGMHQLASAHGLSLIGGDLSRGPLSVTVQLQGIVPADTVLLTRRGARAGDAIYITGCLGAAAYALRTVLEPQSWVPATEEERLRLHRPVARLDTGRQLLGIATSCIDISDGLQADLQHILTASGMGADVELESLPLSDSLHSVEPVKARELALTGGDDYELCFTLPASTSEETVNRLAARCPVTRIGTITGNAGQLLLKDADGQPVNLAATSYRHF